MDLLHDNGILTDPTHPENYYHDPANGHIPDGIPVNFTTNLGAVISPLIMINGITVSTLNIGSLMNGIATDISCFRRSNSTNSLLKSIRQVLL